MKIAIATILISSAIVFSSGCARIPSGVNVVSLTDKHSFNEAYPAAFISRGAGGDLHIVLLKDATTRSPLTVNGPLQPLALSDIRQLLHIHIFWRPMRGTKPDNPSATNAAIDWYLVRAGADGQITGLAHYEGAGLVTASIADDAAGVIIRSGALRPTRVEGDMTDPIGPLNITGRFDVLYHPSAVNDVLNELQKLNDGMANRMVDAAHLTEPAAAAVHAR